ncbi:MAG: glucoamylase family protein [Betaproteobacteria bacterium]
MWIDAAARLRAAFRVVSRRIARDGTGRHSDEQPLRSELFSADQMEQHGVLLAKTHRFAVARFGDLLLRRLAQNQEVLLNANELLTAALRANRPITPAGEWLLDNFYLIEEQIRTARRHLPRNYSRQLPRLATGRSVGMPRVYDIALETIAHGDGRVDPESLTRFVASYQTVTALDLGELWAIPIMIRLALIENLRRVAVDVAAGRVDRDLADNWADQMYTVAESDPKSLILVIADMARSGPPMTPAFVSELARRLRGHGSALTLPLTWVEQRLTEANLTIDQLIQASTQRQAANQVSISNSIGSLRFLAAMDWRQFVESLSVVELKLSEDPTGTYGAMDFVTRDRYRHVVEQIAKRRTLPELEVARRAIALAVEDQAGDGDHRRNHVGYYLIDAGRTLLESGPGDEWSMAAAWRRHKEKSAEVLYVGAIVGLTVILGVGITLTAQADGLSRLTLASIAAAAILTGSQLAVALVNALFDALNAPVPLPRMDFMEGIPAEFRTLVVVPAMLTKPGEIEALVDALEIRFLGNRDVNLCFALLTDLPDSDTEFKVEDAALVQLAQSMILALNTKYRRAAEAPIPASGDIFFLFHRPRTWNAGEKVWMGYERKRGKLGQLNAFLSGDAGAKDHFATIAGDPSELVGTKYVITLDTDTELTRDSAIQLVGAMAHPLNRPCYDDALGRVTAGYGILQPRIVTSLPDSNCSRFARAFGGDSGIDPYTRVVSDVYQDGFGEGSFIGKGIYDVVAFERALKGRFPENRILSHDLLEGSYARAGLLSDVQLYDGYPAQYGADVSRRQRWIRGDWQIASWLLHKVPAAAGARVHNPLSLLSQWKIFDNLRRSAVPAALLFLLIAGWTALNPAWWWTLLVLTVLATPAAIGSLLDVLRKPDEMPPAQHLASAWRAILRRALQILFLLACLPHEASYSIAAIARANWRLLITRKRRLEWTPSSEYRGDGTSLAFVARLMWITPATAVIVGGYLSLARPSSLPIALPFLLLWLGAPAIAWWMSQPLAARVVRLSHEKVKFLHKLARRTWAYFETFVAPADNWLPPDNYQEIPSGTIAHRTSPTNMGIALLADLAAYDFGYLTCSRLVERCTKSLAAMHKLERHAGHFYNWYDTQTLQPLAPRYISTVDSGNLAGHLLTLRAGLLAMPDDCIVDPRARSGLADCAYLLTDLLGTTPPQSLVQLQNSLGSRDEAPPTSLVAARAELDRIATQAAAVARDLPNTANVEAAQDPTDSATLWMQALQGQLQSHQEELASLAPWLQLPELEAIIGKIPALVAKPTLRHMSNLDLLAAEDIESLRSLADTPDALERLDEMERVIGSASGAARQRMVAIESLASQCDELSQMDFRLLYDPARRLFTVGFNVDDPQKDAGYYDLLASEARLTTLVAVAQGQVPQESWFAMGRQLTSSAGGAVLLSWTGSMFEYLMPLLVTPTYENTLLDATCIAAVERQIAYGRQLGIPWGVSESGYNAVDAGLNYQYRAFGVPGLGLKRGLADDVVVAPYASALALMVAPEAACLNLERLAREGLAGHFGLFEAIDYTQRRLPRHQSAAVVRSFMAHHQGMSLLALGHVLLDRPMQRRFASVPLLQATLPLLQERIPNAFAPAPHIALTTGAQSTHDDANTSLRVIGSSTTTTPEVQLLSNGRYHVMVTNAGGGSSRWHGLNVTRWREDTTCDNWGTYCYIRDVASGEFWSTGHHPTAKRANQYEAIFSEGRAEFRRRDHDIDVHTEIAVSPEDDVELRRVRIVNRSRARRVLEFTSYAEVVLAPAGQDASHVAFSNLFVQTEILDQAQAILCTRRPRSPDEPTPWMFHLLAVHGVSSSDISYETDRMRFIGRGNSAAAPQAMADLAPLSGTAGSVLDPIVAIRVRVVLAPMQAATIDLVYGVADTRSEVVNLVEKYRDTRLADRVVELAWTHAQVVLRQINATEADTHLYARLANSIVFANAGLRAAPDVIRKNRRGQSGLWGYAISGDLPIVLLRIAEVANIDLVRQLVQAHAYWRLKGLAVDLVIWNEDRGGYRQLLQDQILGMIDTRAEGQQMNKPGGIFVRPGDQISEEDRILLESVARIIIRDDGGSLVEQLDRGAVADVRIPRLESSSGKGAEKLAPAPAERSLILHNGHGGFTPDGTEYVITTDAAHPTPAPWVNVLANPQFGTIVSESGGTYTWSDNAHEFRITPWSNDPVGDASGEALYLRDEETGRFWSPTPLPARGVGPYVTRHGFGYTVYEHHENGIDTELWVYVAHDAPVKFTMLKVRNVSGRLRQISVTGYVEWVLGELRPKSAMHVVTNADVKTGAIFARNAYSAEFGERVAFFDVGDPTRTLTCDRREFIGRNGTLGAPAAMTRTRLSGKTGPALDPCAAISVALVLEADEQREVTFRLGVGRDAEDAGLLVGRFRVPGAVRSALDEVREQWRQTLGAVQVETPDAALNVLCNGWLVYQTIACRLWARSGFYQSGGAFGFRDQLQDVMALIHTEPDLTRDQILLSAGRQFVEGDVQHWWHPPAGRGVRTRCSDDYLWLPLATARYVLATGDTGILDEPVPFLVGRPMNPGEDSYYDLPGRSAEVVHLYDHGVRAILHGLRFGSHGLPLMGSGDWNDGMNLVGIEGKGESVWLGFFLAFTLTQFAKVAQLRGDLAFAQRCTTEAAELFRNIEAGGWDGGWYRRAYFDDGTPLGSAANDECRIDSISQSWAVLSGGADSARSRIAMDAVYAQLVRRDDALIALLTPPFDHSSKHPGYIRGYVPGVRENGGQYTHAAIWSVMAFAAQGDAKRAWELMDMINPANHGSTAQGEATYWIEPYVVAADVYALPPHTGRGGWSWYTGSAGWMYRLVLESLLGVELAVDKLRIAPCLPPHWEQFKLNYRYRETIFRITVEQSATGNAMPGVWVDGELQADSSVPLSNDLKPHEVRVTVRKAVLPMVVP